MNPMSRLFAMGCLAAVLGLSTTAYSQKANTLTPKEKREGWQLLFDGTSTQGWSTPKGAAVPSGWAVKDGTLTAVKGGKGGDIVSLNQYGDFDLMFDYNLEAEGNSGVKYFYTTYEKGGNLGIEYQLLDDKLAEDNKKENHLTGSFYDVMPPNASVKKDERPRSVEQRPDCSPGQKGGTLAERSEDPGLYPGHSGLYQSRELQQVQGCRTGLRNGTQRAYSVAGARGGSSFQKY